MRYDWMDAYLLQKRGVSKDFQPVWNWIRYQVGGKMFAAICLDKQGTPYYINLKVDPAEGEWLRGQYADMLPGYYSDGRNWISVKPDGQVPDALLRELLDKARNLMLSSFSKKRQREILGLSVCGTDCQTCALYDQSCPGCNAGNGKVVHAPAGKSCPIYACCVNRHHFVNCQACEALPCALWQTVRDPAADDAAFAESIRVRLANLKGG